MCSNLEEPGGRTGYADTARANIKWKEEEKMRGDGDPPSDGGWDGDSG